jgi:ABC-2 type transport system permease protein
MSCKALTIARKTLREAAREPLMLALLLLFPALLVARYSVSFNVGGAGLSQFLRLLALNQDRGAAGAQFATALHAAQYDGKPLFVVDAVASRDEAAPALAERKAALLVVIPPHFSARLDAGDAAPLELVGDPTFDYYVFARSFLVGLAEQFAAEYRGLGALPPAYDLEFVSGTGTMSDLQFGIPGVLIFGVMIGVIYVAMIVVREQSSGTLDRLRLTRVRAADLVVGVALAEALLGAAQVLFAFGVAALFGFQGAGPGALALAALIGVLVSLTVTGLGLLTACFAKTDGQAAALATALMLPLVFLSGVVFPMPKMPVAEIGGRVFNAYDILPTTFAGEAMRRVLIFGDDPAHIGFELAALVALTGAFLALGVILYQRRRLGHAG